MIRSVFVVFMTLLFLSVQCLAAGSGRFCSMKPELKKNCHEQNSMPVAAITESNCCKTGSCMIGQRVVFPSAEISNQIAVQDYKKLNQTLIIVNLLAVLKNDTISNSKLPQKSRYLSASCLTSHSQTRHSKLRVFLI